MKKIIKWMFPPIIISICSRLIQSVKNRDFKYWWKKFSENKKLPPDLIAMVDYFITTPSFKASTKYWNYLNQKNIQQLFDYGYENFKQTIARNYFTWVGGLDTPYTQELIKKTDIKNIEIPFKEILRKHSEFTFEESVLYNITTVLLLAYVKENGGNKYIDILEEPREGNPPFLNYQGKRISQDILNSVLEYLSISRGCDLTRCSVILELGAGSGRTAFCLLKLLKNVKYIVVDIPPALFISQSYLSSIFRDKNIFSFRPFKSFNEIKDEFKTSDIIFLMPDQLNLLPANSVDLFLAIDCLHEMKKGQVAHYFHCIDRIAERFYFKCWEKTKVPFDNITHSSKDYPIKENWKEKFKDTCKVPSTYFEAFYEIN